MRHEIGAPLLVEPPESNEQVRPEQLTLNEIAFLVLYMNDDDAAVSTAIAWIESGGGWTNAYRPEEENPLGGQDTGMWQVNEIWVPKLIAAKIIVEMNQLKIASQHREMHSECGRRHEHSGLLERAVRMLGR